MKRSLYLQIAETVKANCNRHGLQKLKSAFPDVPEKSLESIMSQHYQRKMKYTHYRHYSDASVSMYYNAFKQHREKGESSGFLLRLADQIDLSPALLSRIIVEQFLKEQAATKTPATIPTKFEVTALLKDTTLIEDRCLAYEVYLCVLNDDQYGPFTDPLRHCIGQQYEVHLAHRLRRLGLDFVTEEQLRSSGYDKTPDFKLHVPIAVDGCVVNWIESKALFAEPETHETYLKDQLRSYWNRFGPGMVIYWFGFVDTCSKDDRMGILVRDHMPSDFMRMNPNIIQLE